MSKNKPDASKEAFQENATPVQAFTTPVLPADPENENRSRQGRPRRVAPAKPPESAGIAGAAKSGT